MMPVKRILVSVLLILAIPCLVVAFKNGKRKEEPSKEFVIPAEPSSVNTIREGDTANIALLREYLDASTADTGSGSEPGEAEKEAVARPVSPKEPLETAHPLDQIAYMLSTRVIPIPPTPKEGDLTLARQLSEGRVFAQSGGIEEAVDVLREFFKHAGRITEDPGLSVLGDLPEWQAQDLYFIGCLNKAMNESRQTFNPMIVASCTLLLEWRQKGTETRPDWDYIERTITRDEVPIAGVSAEEARRLEETLLLYRVAVAERANN